METLAYLHHAVAYEAPEDPAIAPAPQPRANPPKVALKKVALCWLLISSSALTLGTATAAVALQYGDSGGAVADLQSRLARLNYFDLDVTGFYGTATQIAVRQFQEDNLILADGVAGLETLALLRERELGRRTVTPRETIRATPTQSRLVVDRVDQIDQIDQIDRVDRVDRVNRVIDRTDESYLLTYRTQFDEFGESDRFRRSEDVIVIEGPPTTQPRPRTEILPAPTTTEPRVLVGGLSRPTPAGINQETPVTAFFNFLDCGQTSCDFLEDENEF
jgi:peptidoglycan hydrolase-like protein with peptidoglycan-binding domain